MPRKVTLDGHVPSRRALWLLRREHPCWRNAKVRTNKYLNNLIEQDHRAIKRRCASMAGFKSFANAAITIAGIELAHRIARDNFRLGVAVVAVAGRGRQNERWHSHRSCCAARKVIIANGKSRIAPQPA